MITSKNLFAKVSLLVFSTFIAGLSLTSVCFGQVSGELDPTFFAGRTTTKIGNLNDFANASAIQADGKIVVVGYTNNGANFDFAVARYNTDGTLDMSFGSAGRVVTPVGNGEDIANAVVIQPDNKILVGGHGDNFALVRYDTNGTLDNSFDGDGKLTTNINGSIQSLAIKSGKIIAAGYSIVSVDNYEMAVARYNLSNGSLDNSFSGDGKLILPISAGEDIATAVGVQLNDRIVLAGYSSNGSNFDFALARLNADGTLDTTLNGTGKVTTPIGSGNDVARAMLILPDNRIVVGGYSEAAGSVRDFAVVCYSVFGVLDNSFDTDGKLTTKVSGNYNSIHSLALQTDGKMVAAGYAVTDGTGGYFRFAAARYGTDGTLDNTFDNDGKVMTQFDGFSENQGRAVAIQADGKIVVAGFASNGIENDFNNSNNDFAVARFNTNGSLDGTFGNRVFTGFSGEDAPAKSVATQADGKIVVAGYTLNGTNRDFAVARYNTDGLLDLTFGNKGRVTTAVGSGNDDAYAVAVQADGKIVVAGVSFNAGINNFAIVRYNPNGSLDNTFGGGNGKMITAVGVGDSTAFAMAIQTNGRIVLAGLATQGGAPDFAIVRYGSNGSLDTGFGNGGRVIMPVGTDAETAYAVKVQTDGKIIVGGTAYNGGTNTDFALVRLNTNGSLDTNFDNDGKALTEMGSLRDSLTSLAIQPDGKIVAAGHGSFSDWNIELARYNTDGSLDTDFDDDGRVLTDLVAGQDDYAHGVAIQTDGKIIIGGFTGTFSEPTDDAAFARYNADGSLDTEFDFSVSDTSAGKMNPDFANFAGDGKVVIPIGGGDDRIFDIALQPDGKIVAVGSAVNGGKTDFAVIRLNGDLVVQGFEADAASRPDGDNLILSNDVVQVRRFLNGTHTPDPATGEFQRADSSPIGTGGNGVLDSTDIVQTRRYQNGSDGMLTARGPMQPSGAKESVSAEIEKMKTELKFPEGAARQLRVESASGGVGQTVTVTIRVDAVGDESEYGFILNYDSSVLGNPVIGAGNTEAAVRSCNVGTAGQINCSVGGFNNNNAASSNTGIGEIADGNNQLLLTVTFTVAANAALGDTPLTLSNVNASNDAAQLVAMNSTNGQVTISRTTAQSVGASGRVVTQTGRGIRNVVVTMTDGHGNVRTATTSASGYFQFTEIPAGETFVLSVQAKRYRFTPNSLELTLVEDLTDIVFTAEI